MAAAPPSQAQHIRRIALSLLATGLTAIVATAASAEAPSSRIAAPLVAASVAAASPAPSRPQAGAPLPAPEIVRPVASAQAVGALHTVRTIPEACTRLEGRFTGERSAPYRLATVRTSERCQARAPWMDAAHAKPSLASGWILNDVIRVPRAGCPSQIATVQVWRKDARSAKPTMDAQGRARIYLKDRLDDADAGRLGAVPHYTATLAIDGAACH